MQFFSKLIFIGLLAFLCLPAAKAQSPQQLPNDTLSFKAGHLHAATSLTEHAYSTTNNYWDCTVLAFDLIRISKKTGDAATVHNKSMRYSAQATALFKQAEPGDKYLISNVMAYKTEGEKKERVVFPLIVILVE